MADGECGMMMSIEATGSALAARVTGVDLTRPLDGGQVAAIEAGMDQYAVLAFPRQEVTDEQQMGFTEHFGELEGIVSRRRASVMLYER